MASAFPAHMEHKLITLVENRPHLWQVKHVDYHKKDVRERSFKEIAEVIGAEVSSVKAKWNSLRSAFSRELRKVEAKRACNEVYVSSWVHYKGLLFITGAGNPKVLKELPASPSTPTSTADILLESSQQMIYVSDEEAAPHEEDENLLAETKTQPSTVCAEQRRSSSSSSHSAADKKRARSPTEALPHPENHRTALFQAAIERLRPPQTDEVDDFLKQLGNVIRCVPSGIERDRLFHALWTKALNTKHSTAEFS